MKKTVVAMLTICLLLGVGTIGLACSGFVVYSDEIYYGMNFDFDLEYEVRFSIHSQDEQEIFLGSFGQNNQWYDMVGYNSQGLFITLQMVPERNPENVTTTPMIIPELKARALHMAETIQDIEGIIGDYRLFPVPGLFYLHSLMADSSGNAIVVEPGVEENYIFHMEDNYQVMTNFYHYDLLTVDLEDIDGAGIDRYMTADSIIQNYLEVFDLEHAWKVLKETTQGVYTRASLIVQPEYNQIFVALSDDFSRIWKIDVDQREISAFKGLEEHTEPLDQEGITVSELMTWN